MRKDVETAVLEDLTASVAYWTKQLRRALTDPSADLYEVDDEGPYRRIQQVLGQLDQR